MKVLIYGLNYAPEAVGIGKYSGELGGWMTKRGHEVRVITAPEYFPEWKVKRNVYGREWLDGAMVWRCPLWVPRRPNGVARLVHLVSFALTSLPVMMAQLQWRPDIIICIAPALLCAPGALVVSRLCGRKTVNWLHIQDFELDAAFELGLLKGKAIRKIAEGIERRLLRSFKRVSSISDSMRQRAVSKGVEEERVILLTNWVDTNTIRPQSIELRNENQFRLGLGIKPDQVAVLYSGSMNEKQGLDIITKAIEILKDCKDIVWILAGEGPGREALRKATMHMPQVRNVGLRSGEEMNDWLNLADIHLLPQREEAAELVLPSKALGMLASGRPMVATAPMNTTLGYLAEQAGIRVEPGDSEGFADAIRKLSRDEAERIQLGMQARMIAEERFEMKNVLEKFEKEIMTALKEGGVETKATASNHGASRQ